MICTTAGHCKNLYLFCKQEKVLLTDFFVIICGSVIYEFVCDFSYSLLKRNWWRRTNPTTRSRAAFAWDMIIWYKYPSYAVSLCQKIHLSWPSPEILSGRSYVSLRRQKRSRAAARKLARKRNFPTWVNETVWRYVIEARSAPPAEMETASSLFQIVTRFYWETLFCVAQRERERSLCRLAYCGGDEDTWPPAGRSLFSWLRLLCGHDSVYFAHSLPRLPALYPKCRLIYWDHIRARKKTSSE